MYDSGVIKYVNIIYVQGEPARVTSVQGASGEKGTPGLNIIFRVYIKYTQMFFFLFQNRFTRFER